MLNTYQSLSNKKIYTSNKKKMMFDVKLILVFKKWKNFYFCKKKRKKRKIYIKYEFTFLSKLKIDDVQC